MHASQLKPSFAILTLILPGPDRKRTGSLYQYRMSYRNPDPMDVGCAMTWDVAGGREPYQIALERTAAGEYHWHCSCADSVYRGGLNPRHVCKHIHGLTDLLPPPAAVPAP